jgi:hypothetical protein
MKLVYATKARLPILDINKTKSKRQSFDSFERLQSEMVRETRSRPYVSINAPINPSSQPSRTTPIIPSKRTAGGSGSENKENEDVEPQPKRATSALVDKTNVQGRLIDAKSNKVAAKKAVARPLCALVTEALAPTLDEVSKKRGQATTSHGPIAVNPLITSAFPPRDTTATWDVEGHYKITQAEGYLNLDVSNFTFSIFYYGHGSSR